MKDRLSGIGGAVGVALLWAALWAAVGALIGVVVPGGAMGEFWLGPAIGMQPGLLGGVVFVVVVAITASGRRLHELPPFKVIACGGAAGLLVGVLPFVINEPPSEAPLWLVGAVVIGAMTLLGAVSAAGSLALARRVKTASR